MGDVDGDDPDETFGVVGESGLVIKFIRKNARSARAIGNIYVAATLVIGSLTIFAFLWFSQASAAQRAEREQDLLKLSYNQQKAIADNVENAMGLIAKSPAGSDRQSLQDGSNKLLDFLTTNQKQINGQTPNTSLDEITYELSSSVVRVGAVLVGIFLIQIMVTFARYYYKISDHLFMASALIALSDGKVANLKATAPLLMPMRIDFGKEPTSPIEKVFDSAMSAIKELSQKIPTR